MEATMGPITTIEHTKEMEKNTPNVEKVSLNRPDAGSAVTFRTSVFLKSKL